uniref:Uncharacterized protein n=1 Tax=viral metagenome TaxID=1070528 RepID=A0A6H2A4U3_9ZZZZ
MPGFMNARCALCAHCGTLTPKKRSGSFQYPDGKTRHVDQVNIPYCVLLNMAVSPVVYHTCTKYEQRLDKTPPAG